MSDKVKVAVRVRPVNRREAELGTKCVVDMESNQTFLSHPSKHSGHDGGRKQAKTFAFDHCFWSMEESNPKFCNQEKVFENLGRDILEQAFEGYNGCIFAYGQTGSGKSYTMMGTREQKGIIPRLCDALFEGIEKSKLEDLVYKVEVSYMEIYNEKVHDLLDPKGSKQNLRVREHNILGPYVDGLSTLVVTSFEDIDNLMSEGNKSRTVAATNMNSESSRSHAVFNIIVTQTLTDLESMVSGEKVSKLSLVDLAGSERAQKTGAVGERLKEGSNINKSLTTLGLVISALADSGKKKEKFVPYRDSVLTWLLKDNLGGNSKTVMVATISPAADNYEETLSTLRYADRAKRIVNHAVINEDPNARIIRELREEVDALRHQLSEAQSMKSTDLKDRLQESEKLMKEMSKTWEEKLQETEKIHHERHAALEKMGISVQTSGIKVEQGTYYLVNLNADPSLNELLVYYLKAHTLIGRPNAPVEQDIQLSGLGIMPEHCLVDLENNDVFITPNEGARTCVNGSVIHDRTKVKHGDRILWGTNHFFRINCPKASSPQTVEPDLDQTIDYDFAQAELMMKELGNDPINEAIHAIEKQHEEEKQEALEKQRQMYERQMQMLRNQLMSPNTPSIPFPPFDLSRTTPTGSGQSMHPKYQQWAQERDKLFKQSLAKLREEVVKANAIVREANVLADEMGKHTEFSVTLQIPASNLSPNRRRGAFVSEPAILVKRKGRANQVWAMEKFENKIIDMREMYEERKESGLPLRVDLSDSDSDSLDGDQGPPVKGDPFYESQENHNLIGVANIFLECLFSDIKLDYQVPIISQQGEIAGKLHVEISKLGGSFMDRFANTNDEEDEDTYANIVTPIFIRVVIKEAKGLPPALSNFVFCHYSFWGHPEPIVVPPDFNPDTFLRNNEKNLTYRFNDRRDFKVHLTEEFVEHCHEGALSIEVWGHRSQGFGPSGPNWELENVLSKSRSLVDRWNEVMRKLELWVEIHELNDQGEYSPVEVNSKLEVVTGGVFQLRQGHSRRIMVKVKPVQNSGTLPIICESINSITIGCITARQKVQKSLDSYQEEDLNVLRERWSEALMRRKQYLDDQIQKLMNKQDKSDTDLERERALIDQWVCLTEERNAVLVPAAGSCIPGAPADWAPPAGMEEHVPVLFLDLNADDMSTPNAKEGYQAAGVNSILPKEHGAKFVSLPIIKNFEKDIGALTSWDSSMHDSVHLNRVTPANERVYLILKATVRLSHPASMELVLRKRLCINIYKKQMFTSMTDMLKKRMYKIDYLYTCGVTYEIVSNIPKASEDLEDMETLAQLAASQNEINASDGETYIEKYIKGVSAVESILTLDRLRQEVAVKECLAASGRPLRKTASVPNIHNMVLSPTKIDEQIRADSIQDLYHPDPLSPTSQFHARPNFLNLHCSSAGSNMKPSPKSGMSPHALKVLKPMRTLLEEQHHREKKPLLHQDTEESLEEEEEMAKKLPQSPDEFQEFESYQSQQGKLHAQRPSSLTASSIAHSSTDDSLAEIHAKSFTPSMASSGYGSQAVSTLTLSSEDSLSIRSIGTDEALEGGKDGSAKSSPKVGSLESGHSESDEDVEDGSKTNNNDDSQPATDKEGTTSTCRNMLEKRDSLLDEVIPELLDSPLEPIQSPPAATDTVCRFPDGLPAENPNNSSENGDTIAVSLNSTSETIVADLQEDQSKSEGTTEDVQSKSGKSEQDIQIQSVALDNSQPNQSDSVAANAAIQSKDLKASQEVQLHVNPSLPAAEDSGNPGQISAEQVSDTLNNNDVRAALERSDTADSGSSNMEGEVNASERDSDPYSVTAMEELERLGDSNHESLSRTNSGTKREVLHHEEGGTASAGPDTAGPAVKSETPLTTEGGQGEPAAHRPVLDASRELERPKTPEPPVKRKLTGSKGKRERPVSCILPSKADHIASLTAAAYEDLAIRSGASPSEEHLSGCEDAMSSFGSRADLDRLHEVPVPSWIQLGESVLVSSSRGTAKLSGVVQYVGNTAFASGPWVGVELDQAEGKNNGSVNGIQYFKCRSRHGIFVRHDKLIWDKRRKGSRKSSSAHRKSMGNLSGSSSSLSRSSTSLNSQPPSPGASPNTSFKSLSSGRPKKK